MYRRITDAEWTQSRVDTLPTRFAGHLKARWDEQQRTDYYQANVNLRQATDSLVTLRIPLDASDASICEAARTLASRCAARAETFHTIEALRGAMERICQGQGVEPPSEKFRDRPAVSRMSCHLWWRRKLRRHHCQALESAAISIGLVNRSRDIYCSNETLKRRLQQNARNTESLENTIARNELGHEFTLAELASKGTGNKTIRRAELMTRIGGFERIARDCAHDGLFMTITCPSRFHKWRTVGGWKVVENPNFDPETNPAVAQRYLAKVWARIRAKLKRAGIPVYGFRIAEPQHDGTPHWHFLIFHDPAQGSALRAIVSHYALQESPEEPGAAAHRVDFKAIDWEKGTAAGYIAKYVSKNIDGYGVDRTFTETTRLRRRLAWKHGRQRGVFASFNRSEAHLSACGASCDAYRSSPLVRLSGSLTPIAPATRPPISRAATERHAPSHGTATAKLRAGSSAVAMHASTS